MGFSWYKKEQGKWVRGIGFFFVVILTVFGAYEFYNGLKATAPENLIDVEEIGIFEKDVSGKRMVELGKIIKKNRDGSSNDSFVIPVSVKLLNELEKEVSIDWENTSFPELIEKVSIALGNLSQDVEKDGINRTNFNTVYEILDDKEFPETCNTIKGNFLKEEISKNSDIKLSIEGDAILIKMDSPSVSLVKDLSRALNENVFVLKKAGQNEAEKVEKGIKVDGKIITITIKDIIGTDYTDEEKKNASDLIYEQIMKENGEPREVNGKKIEGIATVIQDKDGGVISLDVTDSETKVEDVKAILAKLTIPKIEKEKKGSDLFSGIPAEGKLVKDKLPKEIRLTLKNNVDSELAYLMSEIDKVPLGTPTEIDLNDHFSLSVKNGLLILEPKTDKIILRNLRSALVNDKKKFPFIQASKVEEDGTISLDVGGNLFVVSFKKPMSIGGIEIGVGLYVAIFIVIIGMWIGIHFIFRKQASCEFLIDTETEMRKVTWPSREESMSAAGVVIVAIVIFSVYIMLVDMGFIQVFDLLNKIG